jgi:hypothetical protein
MNGDVQEIRLVLHRPHSTYLGRPIYCNCRSVALLTDYRAISLCDKTRTVTAKSNCITNPSFVSQVSFTALIEVSYVELFVIRCQYNISPGMPI